MAEIKVLNVENTKISNLEFSSESKLAHLYIRKTNIVKINLTAILTLQEVRYSDNQEVTVNVGVAKRRHNLNGNIFDEQGRLINHYGNLIDESGGRIDEQGRRLDENGNLI